MSERSEGYRVALADAGIALDTRLVRHDCHSIADAHAAAAAMLAADDPPTAFFGTNYLMTAGILGAIRDHGRPIAVVGFDDFELAPSLATPLTVIRAGSDLVGRLGATLLLRRTSWIPRIRSPVMSRAPRPGTATRLAPRATARGGSAARLDPPGAVHGHDVQLAVRARLHDRLEHLDEALVRRHAAQPRVGTGIADVGVDAGMSVTSLNPQRTRPCRWTTVRRLWPAMSTRMSRPSTSTRICAVGPSKMTRSMIPSTTLSYSASWDSARTSMFSGRTYARTAWPGANAVAPRQRSVRPSATITPSAGSPVPSMPTTVAARLLFAPMKSATNGVCGWT
jgi:hypothetical protein